MLCYCTSTAIEWNAGWENELIGTFQSFALHQVQVVWLLQDTTLESTAQPLQVSPIDIEQTPLHFMELTTHNFNYYVPKLPQSKPLSNLKDFFVGKENQLNERDDYWSYDITIDTNSSSFCFPVVTKE